MLAQPFVHAQQLVPPQFTSTPVTAATEDAAYQYAITVGDPEPLDTVTISAENLPGWLTLTDHGNRTATLAGTPGGENVGSHAVTLRASDGLNAAEQAFAIDVAALPDAPPTARNDTYSTAESTQLNVNAGNGVLANDSRGEDDGPPLRAVLADSVANGTLNLNDNGSFVYVPTPGFSGTDTFTYRARAGSADSEVATVTITITATNDPPTAVNDTYSIDAGTALNVSAANGVLANDTDDEPGALTAELTDDVDHGSLTLNADGSFAYTPAAGFSGTDQFRYRANDGAATSNAATVTITVNAVNRAPVAAPDSYEASGNTTLNVNATNGVLANDTDADDDDLTAAIAGAASAGTVMLNANGSFAFTPPPGFAGTATFTYRASDGTAQSGPATVTITVAAVNRPPSFTTSGPTTATQGLSYTYTAAATDPDGDSLTFAAPVLPSWLTFDGRATIAGSPGSGDVGTHDVRITVSDGDAPAVAQTFRITVGNVNDAPVITSTAPAAVNEGAAYRYDIAAADADGDELTFAAPVLPAWLTLTSPSRLAGTPSQDDVGVHDVTVTVTDGSSPPVAQSFQITVRAVDNAPVVSAIPEQTGTEGAPFTLALAQFVSDADTPAGSLVFAPSGTQPAGLTLAPDGTLSAPAFTAAQVGAHTVRFTVSDAVTAVAGELRLSVIAAGRTDLTLALSAAPNPIAIGTPATWTLTVTNNSAVDVGGVALEGTFTGAFSFDSAPGGCALTPSGNATLLACTLGALGGGTATSVTLTGSGTVAGDVFATATVAVQGGVPIDETPANDTAAATLGIAQSVSATPAQQIADIDALAAVTADLDGDGFDDLAIVTAASVLALMNGADPANPAKRALQAAPNVIGSSGGRDIAGSDLDGDGDVDLAVATAAGAASFVLRNDGGTFTAAPLEGAVEDAHAVALADVDGDGLLDIAFANTGVETVYRNAGAGTFTRTALARGDDSRALVLADLGGDSLPELVVVNAAGNTALYRNDGGAFAFDHTLTTGPATSVGAGDFNGDGAIDLVIGGGATGAGVPSNLVWLNTAGGGRFFLADELGATPTADVAVADLDLDGDSDVLAVSSDGGHRVYANVGGASGTFAPHTEQIAYAGARRAVLGRLSADERVDVALAGAGGVGVFFNDGAGKLGQGDVGAPTLALRGEPNVVVIVSEPYTDAGATATDATDGDVTARIVTDNPVDTAVIGSYTVTYHVTDLSGNAAAPVTRTVRVETREASGGGGGGAAGSLLALLIAAAVAWRRRRA